MLAALSVLSYVLVLTLLMALAYRDLKEYILPDYLNASLGLSFMAFHISTGWKIILPYEALAGALVGGSFLLAIRFFANKLYKQDSLGLGDVKLMTAAGLGLGYPNILMALSLGAFVGLLHGIVIGAQKSRKGKNIPWGNINVPAGVGLAVGIASVMIYQFGCNW